MEDRSRSRSPEDTRRSPERQQQEQQHQHHHSNGHSPVKENRAADGERDSSVDLNPGNNLYVSSLAQATRESQLEEVFSKFGKISRCQVMMDPHSRESRGFGFVTFADSESASAAVEAMNGVELDGRRISVEKARRGRPRTPTPGRYYGPPKRRDNPRYDDRRQDRRDDYYRRPDPRYEPRYDDRGGYDRGGYERGGYDRGAYDRGYDRAAPVNYDRGYDRGPYDRDRRGYY